MNLLKTFESRVSDAFGAAPQGYAAPFSFKRLAKKTAKELEAETLNIGGIDTAPALFTIFVSADDDTVMRPLYSSINREVTGFIEAQANSKGYVFVGKPLTRFMVDPKLRSGKFEVHAENVDGRTLAQLRTEEEEFLSSSAGLGGAAAILRPIEQPAVAAARPAAQPVVPAVTPAKTPSIMNIPTIESGVEGEFAPVLDTSSEPDPSAGLEVIPAEVVDAALQAPAAGAVPVAAAPVAAAAAAAAVPRTQRREAFAGPQHAAPASIPEPAPVEPTPATCMLIDHQSGMTYQGVAPTTALGRENVVGGIVVRDPNVSRRHAELTYDGRRWRITDLGSTNGTLVNDQDIDSYILRDGDVVTVGLTNLEFREM